MMGMTTSRTASQQPAALTPPAPKTIIALARKGGRRWRWLVALVAVGAIWVVFDLYYPRQTDLRDFDAEQVGRLETAMWRSYYDRERLRLFMQLAELLRTQYRLPLIRSNLVAYQAAKAAFIFKDGRHRADYERALPNLLNFYAAIRRVSNISFDVERAAQLELEWWIIHRERHSHAPGELEKALADLSAEIYRVPAERLAEHARLRAEAMLIRDAKAEAGGVTEEDWARIDGLLRASWRALRQAVNS
jgi:transposase-like protein